MEGYFPLPVSRNMLAGAFTWMIIKTLNWLYDHARKILQYVLEFFIFTLKGIRLAIKTSKYGIAQIKEKSEFCSKIQAFFVSKWCSGCTYSIKISRWNGGLQLPWESGIPFKLWLPSTSSHGASNQRSPQEENYRAVYFTTSNCGYKASSKKELQTICFVRNKQF